MTAIKPPSSGPTGSHPLNEAATSADSPKAGEGASGGSFKQALHQAGAAPPPAEVAAQRGADPLASLAREVDAGRMGMDQAVERLLAQTLDGVGAQLTGAQRAELSDLLRDALANDPNLRALRDDRS